MVQKTLVKITKLRINPFLQTVNAVKEVTSEVYVAGSHGTVRPGEMLEATGARAIIRGEPERTVLDLCKKTTLSEICGITYRDAGNIVNNPEEYKWSSYKEYIGSSKQVLTTSEEILNQFANVEEYKKFVDDQIDYGKSLAKIKKLTLDSGPT